MASKSKSKKKSKAAVVMERFLVEQAPPGQFAAVLAGKYNKTWWGWWWGRGCAARVAEEEG
jgi:hypothetical protein